MVAHSAIFLQKDSELTWLVDHCFSRVRETGMLDRIEFHWVDSYTERKWNDREGDAAGAEALGFDNVAFPFIVGGMGIVAGISIALLEHVGKMINYKKL